jgi:hypothetical protein
LRKHGPDKTDVSPQYDESIAAVQWNTHRRLLRHTRLLRHAGKLLWRIVKKPLLFQKALFNPTIPFNSAARNRWIESFFVDTEHLYPNIFMK